MGPADLEDTAHAMLVCLSRVRIIYYVSIDVSNLHLATVKVRAADGQANVLPDHQLNSDVRNTGFSPGKDGRLMVRRASVAGHSERC